MIKLPTVQINRLHHPMKRFQALGVAAVGLAALAVVAPARADTVQARCDVFPRGDDRATSSGLCRFSQRQGFVSIELSNGRRYELKPNEAVADGYLDAQGRPARVEILEANRGQVYRLAEQSIFVFWDPAPFAKAGGANGSGSAAVAAAKPTDWVVTAASTYLKASPGLFSKTVTNDLGKGTVLRNLGCQSERRPTWCQVEARDNPALKGWVWSPMVAELPSASTTPTPSTKPSTAPAVGTPVAPLADLVGSRAGQAENAIESRGYRFVRAETSGDAVYGYWRELSTGACVVIRTSDGRYASIVYGSSSCK